MRHARGAIGMLHRLGIPGLFLLGCGAGAPAAAVRPDRQTFESASGVPACRTPPSLARPLAVDWRPEDRADLEVIMKQSLAVVAYDCKSVRVLPDCRVEGTYGYIGIPKKEQLLRLDGADELAANLPFSGGRVSGTLNRDSSLDVALALVGQRIASRPQLGRAELRGECGSATHFVRSASVGAFVLKTASAAEVRAAADVFAFASSGKSSSREAVVNRDGDLAACEATTADDPQAAPACSALVRLELKAIAPGDLSSPPDPFLEQVTTNACPAGLAEAAGKCGRPTPGKPHLCEYGNPQDCRTQCGAGDAPSCTRLGLMHERGDGVAPSPAAAISSYQRACDLPRPGTYAYAPACGRLGLLLLQQPDAPSPPEAALHYLDQACQIGFMQACQARLDYFRAHPQLITRSIIATAERGCSGGNGGACTSFGWLLATGLATAIPAGDPTTPAAVATAPTNVTPATDEAPAGAPTPEKPLEPGPPDHERASFFYRKGCSAGFGLGCTLLAQAYAKGLGVPQDETRATDILQLACRSGTMSACSDLSSYYFLGSGGLERSDEKGVELLDRACQHGHTSSCFVLGLRYRKGISVAKNESKALEYLKKACDGGDKQACEQMRR